MTLLTGPRAATAPARRAVTGTWILAAGVLLAAFNLRTAVTSVGPLLGEIQRGLGMSAAVAGVLTTLPVLAFAGLGAVTPALARRFGVRRLLIAALAAMSLGLVIRAAATGPTVFLAASALALAGGAVGNVAIPSVVKQFFPHRVGPMTTAYTTALAVGTMAAASLTVPLDDALGDWRLALGTWIAPAALALVPWLLWRDRRDDDLERPAPAHRVRRIWRSPLAVWTAVFFGAQSTVAYILFGWLSQILRDHGYTAAQAGFMLGVFSALGIPMSLLIPPLAVRMRDQRPLAYALIALYPVGLLGLWLGSAGPLMWVWITAAGIAMGTFPLVLTLFALRTRTAPGTAALSAFAQSSGYLVAGTGPLLVGVLYELTGGWAAPFAFTFLAVVVQLAAATYIAKPRMLEDELA